MIQFHELFLNFSRKIQRFFFDTLKLEFFLVLLEFTDIFPTVFGYVFVLLVIFERQL